MIVADTNLIAYLFIPGEHTENSERTLEQDSQWIAPLIWRSELRNVLVTYMWHHQMSLEQAQRIMDKAEYLLMNNEYTVQSEAVLELVRKADVSAYAAEFVVLALEMKTKLITSDKKLLLKLPEVAVSSQDFLRG